MSPKRDYLGLMSFEHEGREGSACRSADAISNCDQFDFVYTK